MAPRTGDQPHSRDLKGLAKELQVPIIALSPAELPVDPARKGKIPQLSRSARIGRHEQDADMVMFLYRPEYTASPPTKWEKANKGETHVKMPSNRNGSLERSAPGPPAYPEIHRVRFRRLRPSRACRVVTGSPWMKAAAPSCIQAGSKMNDLPG